MKIAFLGLGAMGHPMAERLVERGFDVRVWNRTPRTVAGAATFETAGACVAGTSVVVTMLANADVVEAVLDDTVLAALGTSSVVVDMSTSGRAGALRTARRVEAHGCRFVDAPVSGTVQPARRGELVGLVGGAPEDIARVQPLLDALCCKVLRAGAVGQGQALKVVVNGIGAHHLVALASMLALGERAGLERDVILDAATSGAFASPSYIGKRAKLLARDWTPEFTLALARKDVALNVELQEECALTLPVLRVIAAEIERGVAGGLGELDLFALEQQYERR